MTRANRSAFDQDRAHAVVAMAANRLHTDIAKLRRTSPGKQGEVTGPAFRAFVMAGEQYILAIEHGRTDAALDDVGIELDAASRKRVSPFQWFKP